MARSRLLAAILVPTLAALAGRCATAPSAERPSDRFPLDPREGLPGPFEESVEKGWRALQIGDPVKARREFAGAENDRSRRAAAIGELEALVAEDRGGEALRRCRDLLGAPDPTLPLLVACGEAHARLGEPFEAYELYERAAARAPRRAGLQLRSDELREGAAQAALDSAEKMALQGSREEARANLSRALAWSPGSAPVLARAADVECALGEKERALAHYRQALAAPGLDAGTRERAGDLALELGEDAMAVSIFDRLADEDPKYGGRAAEARLSFRIANWPETERQIARIRRLTRAGAASLTWWMCPEVREARVRAGIVASDVLGRRDSRAVMRAISLGLLDVEAYAHRARPDAPLTRGAAAQWLIRLWGVLSPPGAPHPPCLEGTPSAARTSADALRAADRCGLLAAGGSGVVGGPEFTRGLDRLRAVLGERPGRS